MGISCNKKWKPRYFNVNAFTIDKEYFPNTLFKCSIFVFCNVSINLVRDKRGNTGET